MGRKPIKEGVLRKLYAESMGKCMNPDCQISLFPETGDIMERAHIIPYCDREDNSYDNLIILCPNCHTNFDKNKLFNTHEVKSWKAKRKLDVESFFSIKYKTFSEMEASIKPLLMDNKAIFENYYIKENKTLWEKFENRVIVNNAKIKGILENNLNLLQKYDGYESNWEIIMTLITHINEFQLTRGSDEKIRGVLYPKKVNSLFGVQPINDFLLPSTESLEVFLKKMIHENRLINIGLGYDQPYITIKENGCESDIYLHDTPRLRQLYFDNRCFRSAEVRLESLNFILKYLRNNGISFKYKERGNLRNIVVANIDIIFVYEYCLSKEFLTRLSPSANAVIVNLHNWNGDLCISNDAYELADNLDITLLSTTKFYSFIREIK
ncbi:HNH endonuclease [Enterococcus faecium]|nr:HNH endonuclease [Enterococcus faecium]